jgi:cytidyltransferase-like protein
MAKIVVTGSFDDLRSRQVRILEEAAKLGEVQVLLFSDNLVRALEGREPKFPQAERQYFVQSLRYVSQAMLVEGSALGVVLAQVCAQQPGLWVMDEPGAGDPRNTLPDSCGIGVQVIAEEALKGFPALPVNATEPAGRKKVIVSGCYDWLHSGHVRFFEEVSGLGDLYVVVGNDSNVAFLKGAGHPLFGQDERRYMVQAIRFVHQALVSTGWDWLDYAPQVEEVHPDMFAVNEDGDRPEKHQFCREHGIEYVVLKRTPKEGLPRRESTMLRGF